MKKIWWLILIALIVLVTIKAGSSSINPYDYIKVIENKPCLENCYTIYEIKDLPFDLEIKEKTFWFEFRNTKDMNLRHGINVSDLKSFEVLKQESIIENVTLFETSCNMYPTDAELSASPELYEELKCNSEEVIEYKNVNVWQPIKEFTLKAGEGALIKVQGKKSFNGIVDNVMVLDLQGEYTKLVDYAWWNNSFANKTQVLNLTTSDLAMSINGTSGFMGNHIWINPSQCGGIVHVYWNDSSTYAVACNDSSEMYYDSEVAGLPDQNETLVYSNDALMVWHFGDTGTPTQDSTSNNEDGTVSGATWTTSNCLFEGCYNFDGVNDVISNAFATAGYSSGTFTIWTQPIFINTVNRLIDLPSLDGVFYVQNDYTNNYWIFQSKSGSSCTVSESDSSKDADWHFIVILFGAGTLETMIVYNSTNQIGNCTMNANPVPANPSTIYLGAKSDLTRDYAGLMDDFRMYFNKVLTQAEIIELWQNGRDLNDLLGSTSTNVSTSIANISISVTYDSSVFETTDHDFWVNFTFNTSLVNNVTANFLSYNGYNYSTGNVSSGSNWTAWQVDDLTIPLVANTGTSMPFNWNYTIHYTNGTNTSYTTSNYTQTINWDYNTTLTTVSPVTFGSSQYYYVNLSWGSTVNNMAATNFLYNAGSSTPVLFNSGADYNIYRVQRTATPFGLNNVTWIYALNHTQTGFGEVTRNVSGVQNVTSVQLDNCSVFTTRVLNISLWDESNDSAVVGSIDAWILVSDLIPYNISWRGANNYSLCMNQSNINVSIDAQFEYWATNYEIKNYYLTDTWINNQTQLLDFYLTKNSTLVVLNVVDEDDTELENVYINILSYDLGTNSYKTTEIVKTDFNGNAFAEMTLFDQWYRFLLVYQGNTVLFTSPTRIMTTELYFQVNLQDDVLTDFEAVRGVTCSISFNNATHNFNFAFNNPSGTPVLATLEVIRQSTYSKNVINTSSLTSASGNIILGIGTLQNITYLGQGYITESGNRFICDVDSVSFGGDWIQYGSGGLFFTFFLCVLFIMVGYWSPVVAIVLTSIALALSYVLGILYLSWPVFITLLILGGIVVYRLAKN